MTIRLPDGYVKEYDETCQYAIFFYYYYMRMRIEREKIMEKQRRGKRNR